MKSGDKIQVLDTSNDRILEGVVRQVEGNKVEVYVLRFENYMWFADGVTRLGRFKLIEGKRQ